MSTDPFTDETLSAIIDGEADEETVASVQADPVASARLAIMRQAVELVAEPVPEATRERRSASIAAAMAAAKPAAPEVTSLAAARHQREMKAPSRSSRNRQWLAVAAAAVALIVAIPLVLQFRESTDRADTATEAVEDAADSGSSSLEATADEEIANVTDGGGADAMEESEDAMEEEAMAEAAGDEDAMEADAGDSASDDADDAMEESGESDQTAADGSVLEERLRVRTMASNIEIIDDFIALGTLAPVLTLEEVLAADISVFCADTLVAETPPELLDTPMFDIAFLDADGLSEPRLLIIEFNDDGTTTTLDAEDCAQLG